MILEMMLYAVGVAAALSLMGYCQERLAFMRNLPRRWVWPLMMVLSVVWVAGAMLLARPAPEAAPGLEVVVTPSGQLDVAVVQAPESSLASVAGAGAAPTDTRPTRTRWNPPSDRTLLLAWAALSALLMLSLAVAGALLRQRSGKWRRARVRGREVMVSDSVGPALMGTWQPRIVVPEWFMTETAARQELILQHEEQHIAARDPLLLRAALLFTLALPWNLPLWWQLRRMRRAIELDCDARVLRLGVSPVDYGAVLLDVTRRCASVPPGLIAMSDSASALEQRVRHLLPDPSRHSVWRAVAAMLLWLVGIGAALALEAPAMPQRVAHAVPLLPPPPADSEWQTRVRQALVDRHPELFAGAQPESVTFVTMVLQSDGSVASSRARHVPQAEAAAHTTKASQAMKKGFGLLVYESGALVADGVRTSNPLRVFVERQKSAFDDPARFSKADVAAVLERHLPDALEDNRTRSRETPWLVLSHEGRVLRSGYIRLYNDSFNIEAFNAQVPDLSLCAYQMVKDVRVAGASTGAPEAILAWVRNAAAAAAAPVAAAAAVPASAPSRQPGTTALPRLLPPPLTASSGNRSRDRRDTIEAALVEHHPLLVNGPERDGQAFVSMQLRPDGSVESSDLTYVEAGDTAALAAANAAASASNLEPNSGQLLLARGWKIAGDATVKMQTRVSYGTRQDPAVLRQLQQASESERAELVQVVEHYLPGAMTDPATEKRGTAYLIVSNDGRVIKSGYLGGDANRASLGALQDEMPGHLQKQFSIVPRFPGTGTSRATLVIAWVQP